MLYLVRIYILIPAYVQLLWLKCVKHNSRLKRSKSIRCVIWNAHEQNIRLLGLYGAYSIHTYIYIYSWFWLIFRIQSLFIHATCCGAHKVPQMECTKARWSYIYFDMVTNGALLSSSYRCMRVFLNFAYA